MKRVRSLLILLIGLLLFLFLFNFNFDCIFKEISGFPCPGCGLTRAFRCLLSLDIVGCFYYNILAFPLFLLVFVFVCILIYDIVTGKDLFYKILFSFLEKHYLLIIAFVIFSECINIYRGI